MKKIYLICIFVLIFQMNVYADETYDDLIKEHEIGIIRKYNTIRLISVGDIMMHMPIVNASKNGSEYDFTSIFDDVKEYIKSGDIAIANLETTITEFRDDYSGYPRFKSPVELVGDLKEVGFDVLTTANNHSYDNGKYGIEATINAIEENEMFHTGTFNSIDNQPLILNVKKLKIGIASYTYGTNGLIPEKDYMVNLLDKDKIARDYNYLIDNNTDIQIVAFHWGDEYKTRLSYNQIEYENFVKNLGFDIVLGSHPHVIQEMKREDNYFSIFSMGNFISNQRDGFKDLGVIVDLVIEKTEDEVLINRVELIPTWVDKYNDNSVDYKILPINSLESHDVDIDERNHIAKLLNHFNAVY